MEILCVVLEVHVSYREEALEESHPSELLDPSPSQRKSRCNGVK